MVGSDRHSQSSSFRFMAAAFSGGLERAPSASRVVPLSISDDFANSSDHISIPLGNLFQNNASTKVAHDQNEEEVSGTGKKEEGPDDWLPITRHRKGNAFTAAFHLLCSGIGIQSLSLPIAFLSLGWTGGIVCLCILFAWQLYTAWLLVHLHQPSTVGPRYSRYVVLSIVAFGPRLGKWLAIFPTLYLSGGSCALFVITGGSILELLSNLFHPDKTFLTGVQWYLVFICAAVLISQFFPTLHSLAPISLLGSVSAFLYFTLLWTVSISDGKVQLEQQKVELEMREHFRRIINAIGLIALTFRGHNLVLEIQGTKPSTSANTDPPHTPMWKGVLASYSVISSCFFPLAIAGYWAYGDNLNFQGKKHGIGVIDIFAKFHGSKGILATIYIAMLVHLLCAYQLYAMPTWDNWKRVMYVERKKKVSPRWIRCAIRVLFGGAVYFVACAFPFLGSLGPFVGAVTLPLTLVYPCFMWLAIEKPQRWTRFWCLNMGLGCLGTGLSLLLAAVALWTLIDFGLNANFFNPH